MEFNRNTAQSNFIYEERYPLTKVSALLCIIAHFTQTNNIFSPNVNNVNNRCMNRILRCVLKRWRIFNFISFNVCNLNIRRCAPWELMQQGSFHGQKSGVTVNYMFYQIAKQQTQQQQELTRRRKKNNCKRILLFFDQNTSELQNANGNANWTKKRTIKMVCICVSEQWHQRLLVLDVSLVLLPM